jgi:hypothetical protein
VETQKEFVEALATEVRSAAFTNMEDVVAFVRWLDEELSFLVLSSTSQAIRSTKRVWRFL